MTDCCNARCRLLRWGPSTAAELAAAEGANGSARSDAAAAAADDDESQAMLLDLARQESTGMVAGRGVARPATR